MKKSIGIRKILNLFLAFLPVLIFGWKFLPFFLPLVEVFFMNQTFRLAAGLLFSLYWLTLLFLTFYDRRVAALGLLASSLLLADGLHYSGGGVDYPEKKSRRPKFSIYSQNILTDAIKRKKYDLFETIRILDPDVVALQEVSDFDIEILLDKFAEIGYHGYPQTDATPNEALGFAIFSRLPVKDAQAFLLTGVDWSPLWPLQGLEFQVGDRWVCCLNLHLIPPHHGAKGAYAVRSLQQEIAFRQTAEIVDYIQCGGKAAVVCGDFNQTPSSKIMWAFRKYFHDSFTEAGEGLGFTWNMRRPFFRIDYMLHNDKLRALQCRTIPTNYSDHRGIFAEFELLE